MGRGLYFFRSGNHITPRNPPSPLPPSRKLYPHPSNVIVIFLLQTSPFSPVFPSHLHVDYPFSLHYLLIFSFLRSSFIFLPIYLAPFHIFSQTTSADITLLSGGGGGCPMLTPPASTSGVCSYISCFYARK
jgi:hypothetical protein